MRLSFLRKIRSSKPCSPKAPVLVISAIALALTGSLITVSPASAALAGMGSALQYQLKDASSLVEVVVRRGGGVVRGGAVARPGVVRAGVVARPGRWVRPARYTWRPGGAIAAGAAIGFVTAATAAAWAGAPPVADYCWYYTDATQTQGFWDVCP
jgi:hypothetical protein